MSGKIQNFDTTRFFSKTSHAWFAKTLCNIIRNLPSRNIGVLRWICCCSIRVRTILVKNAYLRLFRGKSLIWLGSLGCCPITWCGRGLGWVKWWGGGGHIGSGNRWGWSIRAPLLGSWVGLALGRIGCSLGRIGLMGWGLVPVRIWLMGNCCDAVVISCKKKIK